MIEQKQTNGLQYCNSSQDGVVNIPICIVYCLIVPLWACDRVEINPRLDFQDIDQYSFGTRTPSPPYTLQQQLRVENRQ